MSQENVEIVRKPLRARERSKRTLDQRLSLRFPGWRAAYFRLIGKRPARSRLRQAALWRGARLGVAAYNPGDLDAVVIGWHPEFEYHSSREWVRPGSWRRTIAARRATASTWRPRRGSAARTNDIEPVGLIDLGERTRACRQRGRCAQQASGAAHRGVFAGLDLKDGEIVSTRSTATRRSSRSRRAAGVGDVAGERRGQGRQAASGTSSGGSQSPWSPSRLTKLERQLWRPWGSCSSRGATAVL